MAMSSKSQKEIGRKPILKSNSNECTSRYLDAPGIKAVNMQVFGVAMFLLGAYASDSPSVETLDVPYQNSEGAVRALTGITETDFR